MDKQKHEATSQTSAAPEPDSLGDPVVIRPTNTEPIISQPTVSGAIQKPAGNIQLLTNFNKLLLVAVAGIALMFWLSDHHIISDGGMIGFIIAIPVVLTSICMCFVNLFALFGAFLRHTPLPKDFIITALLIVVIPCGYAGWWIMSAINANSP